MTFRDLYREAMLLSPEERQRLIERLLNPPAAPSSQQIAAILESNANDLRAMGVQKIRVFGLTARGEADPANDIEIYVTLSKPAFREFMQLKFYLEDLFDYSVNIGTGDSSLSDSESLSIAL